MWEELDRLCERAVDNYLVPSAAVAVGDGDGVYYKKAFGYSRVIMNEDKPDGVFHGPIPENAVSFGKSMRNHA